MISLCELLRGLQGRTEKLIAKVSDGHGQVLTDSDRAAYLIDLEAILSDILSALKMVNETGENDLVTDTHSAISGPSFLK